MHLSTSNVLKMQENANWNANRNGISSFVAQLHFALGIVLLT